MAYVGEQVVYPTTLSTPIIHQGGKPNTTLTGYETAGLKTGKIFYALSDSALIFLTVTIDGDPTGKAYGGKIIPDITTHRIGKVAGSIE